MTQSAFLPAPAPIVVLQCLAALRPSSLPGCSAPISRPQFGNVALYAKKGGGAVAAPYLEIEDPFSDAWKLEPVIDILKEGGLGIIPTDTCYHFVTPITSRAGVERLYQIRRHEGTVRKPLSLLCESISQISTYTTALNLKTNFKMVLHAPHPGHTFVDRLLEPNEGRESLLKACLPGPYTFIFPATNDLPRMIVDHKKHAKMWKRKEIGIRIPDDEVCLEILKQLEIPLLCAGVPQDRAEFCLATAYEEFETQVDFVVSAGQRGLVKSSVLDLTGMEPLVLREEAGSIDDVMAFY